MSDTKKELVLPIDLPKCACFEFPDETVVMASCAGVAQLAHTLTSGFIQLAHAENLCPTALPYFLDIFLVSTLTSIAKSQGPALEFGSEEIEREADRLATGLEERVRRQLHDAYKRGRDLGLNEATVRAMMEREAQGGQQS